MGTYIPLTYWELAAASVVVFIDAGLSIIFGLKFIVACWSPQSACRCNWRSSAWC